jgi:anionic cell wall polymer biosynthesis LytR-Cps2A-Psr (LCP) family protein
MRISPVEWSRILENNEKLTFNGEQAVFYARIRNIGDGDARRTSRHRVIMEQVILQLFDLSHAELVSLAWEFMPYVKTSFEIGDIVDTISDYNQFRHAGIFEFMYPTLYAEAIIREMSLVRPVTLESNVIELMKFIYDVEDYQASDALREISQAIEVLQ